MTDWWQPLYDDLLVTMLLERHDPDDLGRTVRFLRDVLALGPGDRVFDQCCGIGSIAIPLARAGHAVVGVDQAAAYVERATLDARSLGVSASFHAGDARTFVPAEPVHGAFNWWTSFGYGASDDENAAMLRAAFRGLVPGGRFALDTINVPSLLRGFQRDVVSTRPVEGGDLVLHRASRIDWARGTIEKTWRYFLPDGRRVEHPSSVRLYLPHTLGEMLRGVGFSDVTFFGGIDREPLEIDSPRCIVVSRRPS